MIPRKETGEKRFVKTAIEAPIEKVRITGMVVLVVWNKEEGVRVLSNACGNKDGTVWAHLSKILEVGKDRHLWETPGGAFF